MLQRYFSQFAGVSALASFIFLASGASAITVTIDGVTSPTVLSDAVDTCMTAGPGPHVINITTNALPTPDRQVFINQAITINGDADADGTPCDILVDMTGIRNGADVGIQAYKSYIEIQAAGEVAINNIKIHPNADGAYANFANSPVNNVSGIRVFKPVLETDTGTYNFTNVGVSGSASDDTYLSLGTDVDLFDSAGVKRWGGLGGDGANEINHVKHAALHFVQDDLVGVGSIVSTIDHCEMGLSRGCAVSVTASNTTVEILGGIFGHSARDGIRISDGANVTIKGTATDRVRVVRSANIRATNAHTIDIVDALVPLIEYVDVAGESTANGIALRNAQIGEVNYFRSLGKFMETNPNNHGIFIGITSSIQLVRNSTVASAGDPIGDPVGIVATVTQPVEFRDSIFTSLSITESISVVSTEPGVATFNYCCLPTDGFFQESLPDPPITGAGADTEGVVIVNNAINSSPQYLLTMEDYDWSDAQGAGDPLNGPGNLNVLRPSNSAFATAASDAGPLTGGAGPLASSIDAGIWMLME